MYKYSHQEIEHVYHAQWRDPINFCLECNPPTVQKDYAFYKVTYKPKAKRHIRKYTLYICIGIMILWFIYLLTI